VQDDVTTYLVKRLANTIAVLLGCSLVVFVILRLSGNPVSLMLSDPAATPEDFQRVSQALGLDKPIPVQYLIFLKGILSGNFGVSYRYGLQAMDVCLERLPATVELTLVAMALVVIVGVPLGILAALRRGSWVDHLISTITLFGQSMPNYWVGIMLILLLSVSLGLLPTSGRGGLRHLIMPAVVLALHPISKITRLARSEFLEILSRDYVRTARAKGLKETVVVMKHALRNASLSLVTVIGMDVGYLLGGAIVTETVFGWPGIGKLMVDAVTQRDFPIVQAATFVITTIVVLTNLTVDLTYSVLDPRVRLR